MNKKILGFPIGTYIGVIGISIFVILTSISAAKFPYHFSFLVNFLSDLGSSFLNPAGAIFFRLATIFGSVFLFLFFLCLNPWRKTQKRSLNIFVLLTQISGCFASIAFLMTGIYSEDQLAIHMFYAQTSFIAFGLAILFSGIALFLQNRLRVFASFLFLLVIVDIIFGFNRHTSWLEWVVIFGLLIYVFFLSLKLKKLTS